MALQLFNGVFNLGVTGSAFAFGVVAEHFGYRPMFGLAAVMPLAACVGTTRIESPGKPLEGRASARP